MFNHFTLASISSFVFGARLEQYTPETEELVSRARDAIFAEITFSRALQGERGLSDFREPACNFECSNKALIVLNVTAVVGGSKYDHEKAKLQNK